jgi:hypothetical protein
MSVVTVTGLTSSSVVTGGTIVVSYPTGFTRGDFVIGARHRISVIGKVFNCPENITVSLGNTSATITYNGTTTIPAGSRFTVELDRAGAANSLTTPRNAIDTYIPVGRDTFVTPMSDVLVNLGTPTTASATAVAAAQAISGTNVAVVITGGAKYSAATLNVPLGAPTGRNLVVVSTNAGDTTQVVSVTGVDMYGNTMRENITLNGTTTVAGKKAFATVSSATVSATMTGNVTIGDSTALGLPVYLPNATWIVRETQDGATATAGTVVAGAGITVPSTATSADVRGTYTPNSAPDGSRSCALLIALPEPNFFGQPQY